MCCNREEPIIADTGGAVRALLMEQADFLIDLINDLEVGEIKISVQRDFDTGAASFKAKVDGEKVLEVKANDFVPCFAD